MTQMSANHPLVSRVARLRQRARMLLALYGAGYTLLTLAGGTVILVAADYYLHFDAPVVRLGLLACLAGTVGAVAWRKMIMPMSTRLTDQFLASRVELVNKNLADELMSALQFIKQDTGRDNIFAAKVVEGAEQRTAGVKFEKALQMGTTGRAVTCGAAALALVTVLGVVNSASGNTGIAFSRWTNPFSDVLWPHMQDVSFDWSSFPNGKAPRVLPFGEPVKITAQVTRGYNPSIIASLYVNGTRDLMTFQEGQSKNGVGVYQKDLSAPSEGAFMKLRVAAGDHFAETRIALAARPMVNGLKGTVQPPEYVKGDASVIREFDMQQGPARAVEGSRVHLIVRTTKPLEVTNGVPSVQIMQADHDEVLAIAGLQVSAVDSNSADLSFIAKKPVEFRVQVTDTDGFTNILSSSTRIDVSPDAMPSVIIAEPRHEVQAVPDAEVQLKINVSDDLGLSELILQADGYDAKSGEHRFTQKLSIDNQVADGATRTVVGSTTYVWKLADLKLKPGERLSFYAQVRDNYSMPIGPDAGTGDIFETNLVNNTVQHKLVTSSSLTLVIRSKDDIIADATKTMEHLAAEVMQVHDQQKTTREKTEILQKELAQGTTTTQQQQDIQQMAQEETNEAQHALAIQQKIEQVRETLATNKLEQEPIGQLAKKSSDVMMDVGKQDMPKATTDLNQAKAAAQAAQQNQQKNDQSAKAQAQQQAQEAANQAQAAAGQQQTAEDKLQKLAKEIQDRGMLAQMESKVDDLKKRQDEANAAEQKLAEKTQGKDPGELTTEEKAAQQKIADDQKQLATEQRQLEKQLGDGKKDLEKSNPAASQAMGNAQKTSQQQQIAQNEEQAGQSAQQNQTNSTQQEQQKASAGLAEMKKNLQDAQKYEQERIAAETADLLKLVTMALVEQTVAKEVADKAGEKATVTELSPLGDRERKMNVNLVTLRDRSTKLPNGDKIAADLKDAQGGMQDATGTLMQGHQPPSVKREGDAITALTAAVAKLQKAKDRDDAEKAKNDLAEIRAEFEKALKVELALRGDTNNIAQHVKALGSLPAVDQTQMGTMSEKQGDTASNVQILTNGKLKEYEEYIWMSNQIIDFMGESKNRLAKADIGRPLSDAQNSAILRLSSIIDSLKEAEDAKDKFLKEQNAGGGGGGGGGGKKPLIANEAEFKLLKQAHLLAMQDTVALNQAMDAATNDGERADLKRQSERVADEQNKVRELTQKVWDKMQSQQ